MTPYVSRLRSAKANAKTAISTHAVQMLHSGSYWHLSRPLSPAHVGLQGLLRPARV